KPWFNDPYFMLRAPPPTPENEICSCRDDPPIKLMSLALLSENPIHCLRCNLEIPPERLRLDQPLVDASRIGMRSTGPSTHSSSIQVRTRLRRDPSCSIPQAPRTSKGWQL